MEKVYKPENHWTMNRTDLEYVRKLERNSLHPLKAVFAGLINLGIGGVDEPRERKYVKAANFILLISCFSTVLYLALAIMLENTLWIKVLLFIEAFYVLPLILNGYERVNLGRWLFLIGTNAIVFGASLMVGPVAHIQNGLMLTAVLPFLIFDARKWVQLCIGVTLPLVLLFFFYWADSYFLPYNLDMGTQMQVEKVSMYIQMLTLIAMFYQLVQNMREAEDDLSYSHAQMEIQTAELKRSNADLEQFAYIISHDLKAPVRNISSFMNLLLNKYAPSMSEEAREFVGYSHAGSKRLERLIDDVLAYCRIGTNLPKPVPVELNDVVKTIEFELRGRLQEMNAVIHVSKDLPQLNYVHASLMYHIFLNLISNGLKFNKKEHPEITIGWTNSLNHYSFFVKDNGIGISKEYSATIFQMFKRLHTEQEYDGTGIGLAICKKIVEYYNGEIWFESTVGEGTTFYFTIRKF